MHRQAWLAITGGALFGGQLFEHIGDIDFLVERNAAASLVRPHDFAAQLHRIGQRDFKLFADADRHIGGEHHAPVGYVANAP